MRFDEYGINDRFTFDGEAFVKTGDRTAWSLRAGKRYKEWAFTGDEQCVSVTKLTLADMTTRELLSAVRAYSSYSWNDDDSEKQLYVGTRFVAGGVQATVYASHDELISALSMREHVSNKREGKVIRRLRAQTGHDEAWLRAHPKFGQEIADAQFPNRREVTAEWAASRGPLYGKNFGRLFKVVG